MHCLFSNKQIYKKKIYDKLCKKKIVLKDSDVTIPDYLSSHGIDTYIYNDVPNILHCKFILTDDHVVVTGSQNFFKDDILNDYEMLMRLETGDNQSFVNSIADYFSSILNDNRTTPYMCKTKITQHVEITGQKIIKEPQDKKPQLIYIDKLFFSPEVEAKPIVLETIDRATRSVMVMEAFFDDREIQKHLIDLKKKNIEVYVLTNFSKPRLRFNRYLFDHGIYVRMYGFDNSLMHHKTILIDDDIVFTGSLNLFSRSLNFDREFAVIFNDKSLNDILKNQFQIIWNSPYVLRF